jgi:parallel beta-helix repeat protein
MSSTISHIINNTVKKCSNGIAVYSDTVTYLNVSFNSLIENDIGLHVFSTVNGLFDSNIFIRNKYYGLQLDSAKNNTITNNNFTSDSFHITGLIKDYIFQNMISNNLINGKNTQIQITLSDFENADYSGILSVNSSIVDISENLFRNCSNSFYDKIPFEGNAKSYQINASQNTFESNKYGVRLDQTNKAVIRNNVFDKNNFGVDFNTVNDFNAEIKENSFFNNNIGINLYHNNNYTVIDNLFKENKEGMHISQSDYGLLSNNRFILNEIGAISDHSDNQTIIYNYYSKNIQGLSFTDSFNNTIKHNSFKNDGMSITYIYVYMNYILQREFFNNTVNGKKIVFLNNLTNTLITDTEIGQIIGHFLTNVTFSGLEISNTSTGIYLRASKNIVLTNNIIKNNSGPGLRLYGCSENTIIYNQIMDNKIGIDLDVSKNNTINENTFIHDGIFIHSALYSSMIQKEIKNNIVNGKQLFYSYQGNNIQIPNDVGQIILVDVQNATISNLVFDRVDVGITLINSSFITIGRNTFSHNSIYGVFLFFSSNNKIQTNTFLENTDYGIFIFSSNNNLIRNNDFLSNAIERNSQTNNDGINNIFTLNYWDDWSLIANDTDKNGLFDEPYKIYGLTVAYDNFSLTEKNLLQILGSPPEKPIELKVHTGELFVYLEWLSNANSFNIYRGSSNYNYDTILFSSDNYFNDTLVEGGKTYYYFVTAKNEFGESFYSESVQATPIPKNTTLPDLDVDIPKPNALTGTAGNGFVYLTWSAVTATKGPPIKEYYLYRWQENENYAKIATVTQTNYNDTSVTTDQFYYYMVTAVNAKDDQGLPSNILYIQVKGNQIQNSPSFEYFAIFSLIIYIFYKRKKMR